LVNSKDIKFKLTRRLKVIFAFFISILLILQIIPPVFSSRDSGVTFETSDFGILRALDTLLDDKEVRLNSAEIKNETENRLKQMTLTKSENEEPELNYQVKSVYPIDPRKDEPIIFEAIKKETIANQNDIIDFLLDQPLNYYIYTRVDGTSTWTKAALRPTIVLPKFNPWRWENIDVDNNSANGDEIRVRFDIVYDNILDGIQILPDPKISLSGGLGLTMERLVNRSFSLELYIAKSISYEGQNYIWTTGVTFDSTPIRYTSELLAESIEMQGMARTLLASLLTGGLGNLSSATLAEINGPYSLRFSSESNLQSFDLMAGMIKYENFSLTNKNWLIFSLTPADGYPYITHSGEIWVDSSDVQAPLDNLRWTSGFYDQSGNDKIPVNLRIRYTEDRDDLISANVELINLPDWFEIKLDYTKVVDGINVTVLDYSAANVLGLLNYTSYLFPDIENNPSLKTFNCTHVELEDVPNRLHMEMTTDIGRDINLSINNNPQLGIVSNLIDNLVSRLANRFYRIGRYLKLAAEGILELPTKDGYAIIDVFDEQYTRIEFYQSNGKFLAHPGNYIGFYNQSYGISSDNNSSKEILPIAISGRLSGLKYATLNFGTPLEFELRILNNEPFTGLLVDGENYGFAAFSNVPEYIKVSNLDNNSFYSTIDPEGISGTEDGIPIDQFLFAGRFDDQFMKFEINQIPGSLEFNHKEDIISFSTIDDGFIGEFKYQITNDISKPFYKLDIGDNIFIYQDDDIITSSGMLSGLSQLTYDSSENGYFELIRDRETAFHVMLIDNTEENTKAKLILDPLPSNFLIQLPGIIKTSSLKLPDFTNFSQSMDISKMVFTLGSLGEEAIKLLGNLSQGFIDSIGNIGVNFSISYELESIGSTLDLIAEIERGGLVEERAVEAGLILDPYSTMTEEVLGTEVGWTHGICMLAEEHEDIDILRGHLYLQGMPRIASLKSSFTFNTTEVDLDFREYYPRYSWLLIDLKGIQDRDVNVFFQRIPSGVDFKASVNLTTNLEIGGEMIGDVDISIKDTGSDFCTKQLGALYIYMHTPVNPRILYIQNGI
jgi:hypothetical protein